MRCLLSVIHIPATPDQVHESLVAALWVLAAAGPAALGRVDLGETLAPVLSALNTLAQRRGVTLESDLGDTGAVRLEQQDLQEIAGNLLENAINWAESQVKFRVEGLPDGLALMVEDDGPGLSDTDIEQALTRGTRLDADEDGLPPSPPPWRDE